MHHLKKLLELLKNPPEGFIFEMGLWCAQDHCGTVGCAVGMYIWHEKLHTGNWREHNDGSKDLNLSMADIQRLFSISYQEAANLFLQSFYPTGPITEEMVITRLENFIKEKEDASES